jgi:DNA adenine methylase
LVRNISKQGHTVFVSEYNSPADFVCVWQKETKSSLSANGKIGGNKVSVEKLFKFSPTNAQ